MLEVLAKYEEKMPKSNTHLRLAIEILSPGPDFESKLLAYMRPLIVKGVPSTLTCIKSLYANQEKVKVIGNLLSSMCAEMEKSMYLMTSDEQEQDPTVQLWLYYFLA